MMTQQMLENEPVLAVSWDFGQTLAELDTAMLARRCSERGVEVPVARLDGAVMPAWRAYNTAVRAGAGGHPWQLLMQTLLEGAGVSTTAAASLSAWLWTEQPARNLWRRPIPGMIELVRALRARGVPNVVTSNSEGHLVELAAELGWLDAFDAVVDSGRLGIEKPDPRIFAWAAGRIGVPPARVAHVGDAWSADFLGARGAGMRAVLFRGGAAMPVGAAYPEGDARCARCDEASELAEILRGWGLPG
ncbi:MAG: HAD family hydrolase [Polyangiales bacterium]